MESPQRTVYRGREISLDPLDAARDAPDLFAASHGSPDKEALWRFMGYGPFRDEAAMRSWLEERAVETDPLFFAVVDNESSRRIGMVSFLAIVPDARRLEIGHIWYTPGKRRRRANTEAVLLMLGEAFERLGCRRVEWKCDARNEPSRRAALRLGFTYEGTFRQHMIVKGDNRDTAWFSMLDREWPEARAALQAALG